MIKIKNTLNNKEIITDSLGLEILSYVLQEFKVQQKNKEKYFTTYLEVATALNISLSTLFRRVRLLKAAGLIGWYQDGVRKSEVWTASHFSVSAV